MPSWHSPCKYQMLKTKCVKHFGARTHIPTYYSIIVIFTYSPCYFSPREILLTLSVSKLSACFVPRFVVVIIGCNEHCDYVWNSVFGTWCLLLILNLLLVCLWGSALCFICISLRTHILCDNSAVRLVRHILSTSLSTWQQTTQQVAFT